MEDRKSRLGRFRPPDHADELVGDVHGGRQEADDKRRDRPSDGDALAGDAQPDDDLHYTPADEAVEDERAGK